MLKVLVYDYITNTYSSRKIEATANKYLKLSSNLNCHRKKAILLLNSKKDIDKPRYHDVEIAFGHLKHNHGFKRFMLRGKGKVKIEWGLLSIARNLKKKAT